MADFHHAAAARMLHWLLTPDHVARPTALYLALFKNSLSEVNAIGYKRQVVTFAPDPVAVGVARIINSNSVSFTASMVAFGAVSWLALFETPTGGNHIWKNTINGGSRNVKAYDSLIVNVGSISITMY